MAEAAGDSALKVTVTDNREQVFRAMDAFADAVASVAIPRALTRLAEQAETAGLREMSSIYRIPQKTFKLYLTTKPARKGDLEASIEARGRGFPLSAFSPRVVRGKGGGVSVSVKGRRFLIPHAFLYRGHVFARGGYKGSLKPTGESFGRFKFGRSRLPISEIWTFSAPGAFSNEKVTDAMNARVAEQAGKVLAQEVRFFAR